MVRLVADPGEEGDQHLRAGLGGRRDGGGVLVAQEVEGGHHDEPVCREVRSRVHDVGGDALVAQQPVDRLAHQGVVQGRGGHGRAGGRPGGLVVPQDRDLCLHRRPAQLTEALRDGAELADLAEARTVAAGVGDQGRVELLGARARLAPLEEADGVRAPGHVRDAVADGLAGGLRGVDRLPVDGARGVLHQHPRPAAGEAPGEVATEGQLGPGVLEAVDDVVVGADHVLLGRPLVVVEVAEVGERHEVRRHRDAGGVLVQDRLLRAVEVEQGVGAEPRVVQLVRRVRKGGRAPRREDLLPVGVALAPERGAPGVVEVIQGGVAATQPAAEGGRAGVAVARQVVAGVLVGDVPQGQGGVVVVALGQLGGQGEGMVAVHGGAGAPRLPAARPQRVAVAVHGEDLGVGDGQPGWRRRGRGREVDGDPVVVQEVHGLVEPGEVVLALGGLEPGPREDAERHEGDACFQHQLHVLTPRGARPLLGVVVAAEGESVFWPRSHAGQCRPESDTMSTETNIACRSGVGPASRGLGRRPTGRHRAGTASPYRCQEVAAGY